LAQRAPDPGVGPGGLSCPHRLVPQRIRGQRLVSRHRQICVDNFHFLRHVDGAGQVAHLPVVQETTEPQEAGGKSRCSNRMSEASIRRAASSSRFGVEQGYMSGESSPKLWACPNT